MNEIYVGEIVGTHGIKGEVRLISEFREKELAFLKGKNVYIGKDRTQYTIRTYRPHKQYDMLTFDGVTDINDVIDMRFSKVYMNREDIETDKMLEEDYVGMDVYIEDKKVGTVTELLLRAMQDVLVIKNEDKKYMVPMDPHFIEKVEEKEKRLYLKNSEGFFHEN
ncbi:MAG: 16S rRNA processing protein RimM [Firmicutes bacterium]|nr:16S rRNA processing protein RimM [Bacillota bacterium]